MRCPTLSKLPDPPSGKTGWPWTEETQQLLKTKPNGQPWPRISIVTPSYNQGVFIEETIRSVLLQGYPDLEFIVMDGGSTDATIDLIKKYEPWLAYWISAKDRGQSDAINRGIERATGDIVAWINSDDMYLENALAHVGRAWQSNQTHWLAGKRKVGETLSSPATETLSPSAIRNYYDAASFWLVKERGLLNFSQPEVFVSRYAWRTVGGLFEPLVYAMDYHLWCKLAANGFKPQPLDEELAFFRLQPNQKTGSATENYNVKKLIENAWAVYDTLPLAKKNNTPQAEVEELSQLLEKSAGGFCRIIDAYYKSKSWSRFIGTIVYNTVVRPNTTIRWTPRSVMIYCLRNKHKQLSNQNLFLSNLSIY